MIRAARKVDLPALRELERAAGAVFRDLGMAAVADDEPPSLADLGRFQSDGRAWVYTDATDHPIAYLLVEAVDGSAHIEQVSVHPSHARQGLGRALVETAAGWAHRRALAALTLTTYAEVPWNAPYYERLGFQLLPADQLTDGLRRIVEHEAARGPRPVAARDYAAPTARPEPVPLRIVERDGRRQRRFLHAMTYCGHDAGRRHGDAGVEHACPSARAHSSALPRVLLVGLRRGSEHRCTRGDAKQATSCWDRGRRSEKRHELPRRESGVSALSVRKDRTDGGLPGPS